MLCSEYHVVLLADEPDFPAIVSQLIYDYSTKCVRVCFSFMLCCMSTITLCFEHRKVIFTETRAQSDAGFHFFLFLAFGRSGAQS